MPIIKYVAVHSTPLSNIEYILNGDKNDDMKFASGLNCSVNPQSAYDEFRRTFEINSKERFFKSEPDIKNYGSEEKPRFKEKVRIHHYIQSFDPKENVTPEEAHKIGLEWAKKTFGENMQVIVSTHLDKGHTHNHFAVAAYDLDGKKRYGNYTTLNRARKISDEIALEHGLSIIKKPKHKNTAKYSEWLAKKNGSSWKSQLAEEIDKLILREDVGSISDLGEKLKEQGYTVKSGKYLSVKAPKQKNAIRSFRLGDGYSVEDLQYRILHKEREISLTAILGYSGVQREYAICMRQMQMAVFTKKTKRVTYEDLRKSAELLTFLTENSITSAQELENRLNNAADDYNSSVRKSKELASQIETVKKIVADGKIYLDLSDKDFLTAEEKEEYKKVAYIEKKGIENFSDLEQRQHNLENLKSEFSMLDEKIQKQKGERDELAALYETYKRTALENPYEEIMRLLEEEQAEREERENEKVKIGRKGENEKVMVFKIYSCRDINNRHCCINLRKTKKLYRRILCPKGGLFGVSKNNEMYEAVGRLDNGLTELDRAQIANRLGELSGKYLAEAQKVIDKLNNGSELTKTEKVKIACWLGWLSGGELE